MIDIYYVLESEIVIFFSILPILFDHMYICMMCVCVYGGESYLAQRQTNSSHPQFAADFTGICIDFSFWQIRRCGFVKTG